MKLKEAIKEIESAKKPMDIISVIYRDPREKPCGWEWIPQMALKRNKLLLEADVVKTEKHETKMTWMGESPTMVATQYVIEIDGDQARIAQGII